MLQYFIFGLKENYLKEQFHFLFLKVLHSIRISEFMIAAYFKFAYSNDSIT